jgi:hypothetical protein
MPSITEAAVPVTGRIVDVEQSFEFANGKITTNPDGVRVLIATGDGMASVKLNLQRVAELKPDFGKPVAWWIRPGASGGGDRAAKTWTSFVRVFEAADLGRFEAALAGK